MGYAEHSIEKHLYKLVTANDGLCLKFNSAHSGVPDRVIVLNGHTVFVELKCATGRLSKIQLARIDQLRAAGAKVWVLYSKEQVKTLVAQLLTNPTNSTESYPAN